MRLEERYNPPFSTHDVELLYSYVPSISREKLVSLVEAQRKVNDREKIHKSPLTGFLHFLKEVYPIGHDFMVAMTISILCEDRLEGRGQIDSEQKLIAEMQRRLSG